MTRKEKGHYFVSHLILRHSRAIFVLDSQEGRKNIAAVATLGEPLMNDAPDDLVEPPNGIAIADIPRDIEGEIAAIEEIEEHFEIFVRSQIVLEEETEG